MNNFTKKFLGTLTIILPLILFCMTSVALAAGNPGQGGGQGNPPAVPISLVFENPFKVGNNLYDVVKAIVEHVIMPIGGVLCVLAFIWAGFQYVTAGGDQTKIKKAHQTLLYTVIGTAILLGAWVISEVVQVTIDQVTHL